MQLEQIEAQWEDFDNKVESLAQDWEVQLDTKGHINHHAFTSDVTYQDLIDWAKQDGITYPYDREDYMPILMYFAREYLAGSWD